MSVSDSDDSLLRYALNEIYVDKNTFDRINNSEYLDRNGDRIIIITDGDRKITCICKYGYNESPRGSICNSDDSDI